MHRAADMSVWHGRIDQEPAGQAKRWHQSVGPLPAEAAEPGLVLLGVCSDTGVKRNQGRVGARKGPDAIRAALAGQAWHLVLRLYDAGNLYCDDENLEGLQAEQAALVKALLDQGHFPLLLGGGHELAFGSWLGLRRHLDGQGNSGTLGIINFDAHFDLRKSLLPTSGTPFLQIADECGRRDIPFRYLCLGLSEVANTLAVAQRARKLGADWLRDEDLSSWKLPEAQVRITEFLRGIDTLYLTLDLDVLCASVAPGVSAPAARGVSLEVLEHLLGHIRAEAGAKLRLADIAECNPEYDIDGRTARVAARLCHLLAR